MRDHDNILSACVCFALIDYFLITNCSGLFSSLLWNIRTFICSYFDHWSLF